MPHPRLQRYPFAHPYYRSPVAESCLKSYVELDKLPMFNPLSSDTRFPTNTVYPYTPYFQAQGYLTPRNNRTLCGLSGKERTKLKKIKGQVTGQVSRGCM